MDLIIGKWKSEHGDRTIEFVQKGDHFDAIIKEANDQTLIGKTQISELKKSSNNNYSEGTIFIIKNGKKGICSAILKDGNELEITGKMGFLSRTTKWYRTK
ncbi:DUF2147 domain-containing protein [Rhizosphaericola mali]|uniref:DUF2147 domain-containing protein n=1 Tax=Rhizosphaericola mali TaxID=2545455 RepID=UPI0017862029|nr:DUF2147 domain-containing protein [Rhizosphaericola mali]